MYNFSESEYLVKIQSFGCAEIICGEPTRRGLIEGVLKHGQNQRMQGWIFPKA